MTMTERFEYVLEPLREGADFTVYRGRRERHQHLEALSAHHKQLQV